MMHYWLIKSLLILALIAVTYLLIRPTRSASSLALRRIGMFLVLAAAVFAILFPGMFNSFARVVGVMNGTNLLVYLLVVAIFAQMATSYRRDAAIEARLTTLAREVAIQKADAPPAAGPSSAPTDGANNSSNICDSAGDSTPNSIQNLPDSNS